MKEEPKIDVLNDFLEEKINFYSRLVDRLEAGEKPDTKKLDALFRETIGEVWS
jgi:hypothetical protein